MEEKELKKIAKFLDKWEEREIFRKIDEFHEKRITKLKNNETRVELLGGPKVILHLVPIDSLHSLVQYDLYKYTEELKFLKPLRDLGFGEEYNFDGLLRYHIGSDQKSRAYVQIFANGIIEAVGCYRTILKDEDKIILIATIEEDIVAKTSDYLECQKNLGLKLPIVFYLKVLAVKKYSIKYGSVDEFDNIHPVDRDDLNFPKIIIDKFDIMPEEILRTSFYRLWNAAGYARSFHYNPNGTWKEKV